VGIIIFVKINFMEYLPNIVAGLSTLVLGFLWYGPKAFQGAWMKAAGVTEETMQGNSMAVVFGLAALAAIVLSLPIEMVCRFHKKPEDINFLHGAFHGFQLIAMVGIPILITNALFERKGLMYMIINGGYWLLVGAVMGGILMVWNP